ncbi:MAG: hypothetical protein ACKORL_03285, partial [Phycisphaerales bacterium]
LFECVRRVGHGEIPLREFDEGRLEWIAAADVERLPIPATDRDVMWPLVQAHRGGGFFGVDIDCSVEPMVHRVRESRQSSAAP